MTWQALLSRVSPSQFQVEGVGVSTASRVYCRGPTCSFSNQQVRVGVVIDDDGLAEGSTQARKVFHKPSLHGTAGVSVETVLDEVVTIEHIQQWVCILAQTGREHDDLELSGDGLQESVHVGALQHVDGCHPALNFDVDHEVVVAGGLEGGMDQCLVQVQDECFLAMVLPPHRRQVHDLAHTSFFNILQNSLPLLMIIITCFKSILISLATSS